MYIRKDTLMLLLLRRLFLWIEAPSAVSTDVNATYKVFYKIGKTTK